ncbi:MAG TPA: hypothetical protein VNK41_05275 [Vicinamibacterales bacterium]|nr:hypothetical protein [Vicinamibacterales bacterium]
MHGRLAAVALMFVVVGTAGAAAQVLDRPTPRPTRTAVNEDWYVDRLPIFVNGDYYYPAGASVFFDQNTMVLTGFYDGVPIYVDTTLEPHSIIFVPVARGLMQPYERRRAGDIVGTTGSRPPSFPLQRDAEARLSLGEVGIPEPPSPPFGGAVLPDPWPGEHTPTRTIPDARNAEPAPLPGSGVVRSPRKPRPTDGVWIEFQGSRWYAAGPAVVFDPTAFDQVGEYNGFPVFRSRVSTGDRIYIPSRSGIVAPYERR